MSIPINTQVNTNHLRESFAQNNFSFGNPNSAKVICLVGSCRIVPMLNYLRAYNTLNGDPFELLCLNPVEMWDGPGSDLGECATKRLEGYHLGDVDYLICESMKRCGVLNTFKEEQENVFTSLGCSPEVLMRVPNWHYMHMYHEEIITHNEDYKTMDRSAKVQELRERGSLHKGRFIENCRRASFPELEQWVEEKWLTERLGWTSEHLSRTLSWKVFELVCEATGIDISPELASHPFCTSDPYASTGAVLTELDYEANNWRF